MARLSRLIPTRMLRPLFDQLVGAQKERLGDREPDHLRGLEINHQLELDWSFDWQISYPGTLENTVDVSRCALVHVRKIGP